MSNLGNTPLFYIVREKNFNLNELRKRYFEILNLKEQYIKYNKLTRTQILDIVETTLCEMSTKLRNGSDDISEIVLFAFKKISDAILDESDTFKTLMFSCKDIRDFDLIFKIIDEVNNEYKRD